MKTLMHKNKNNVFPLLVLLSLLPITGCKTVIVNPHEKAPIFIEKKMLDFTKGKPSSLVCDQSDNYTNGGVFGCDWSKDNISYTVEEGMTLSLTKDEYDIFYGAEQKTIGIAGMFRYGYYGAYMKPSNLEGTASTFFLYTGESDHNPHDEIDFEFLGKDTTKVQLNYFTSGVGGNEKLIDLGFDAAEDYHFYSIYWDETRIVWYVDYNPVYIAYNNIPTHYMRIFQNFWCGNQDDIGIVSWMGRLNKNKLPASCSYKYVCYADLQGKGITVPAPKPDTGPIKTDLLELGLSNTANYSVKKEDDGYEVSFTQKAGAYHHLRINNLSSLTLQEAKYAVIKVQNISERSYDFLLSYYDQSNECCSKEGNLLSSKNSTSSYLRHGSTSEYFTLGSNDIAEFKVMFRNDVNSLIKADIIADARTTSDSEGIFKILDWYIVS